MTASYTTYVLVYVVVIVVIGNSPSDITAFIHNLNSKFALKDKGPLHYFLGIKVHTTATGGFILSQSKYIKDLLHKAKMFD